MVSHGARERESVTRLKQLRALVTVARGPIINSRLIGFSVLIPRPPIVIIPDGCNYRRGNIRLHVVESLRAVHVITFPSFAGLN